MKQIIKDTDRFFMEWAIEAIMKWKGGRKNDRLIHIHGDNDRIFPVRRIRDYIKITDGGHFMIVNRADEISDILRNKIRNWA